MKNQRLKYQNYTHLIFICILFSVISSCSTNKVNNNSALTPTSSSTETTVIDPILDSTQQLYNLCNKTTATLIDSSKLQGSLFFRATDKSYVYDVSSKSTYIINVEAKIIQFSNSGKLIADNSNKVITMISKENNIVFSDFNNAKLNRFLENDKLLLNSAVAENESLNTTLYLMSENGQKETKVIQLPMYDFSEDFSYTQYSPNVMFVLYPQLTPNTYTDAILNIENNKLITINDFFISRVRFGPYPIWMPNSEAVTAVLISKNTQIQSNNYYNIYTNGKISQITHIDKITNKNYSLDTPVWSPNSSFLAIPISFENTKSLWILDNKTGVMTDTCVLWDHPFYLPLTWSPDNKYLATQLGNNNLITILEIDTGKTYEFSLENMNENLELLGWLNWDLP